MARHPNPISRAGGAARRDPSPGSRGPGRASRVGGQPGTAADHRGPDGSRVDQAPRHRRGHRSSSHRVLLAPWTVPKRRRVRRAVGHQPIAGQQRQDGSASAQPRRRPSPEQRDPHHRHHPHAVLPTTKNYIARRTAEGKSSREIQRCLKRYIARELYRALNASTTLTSQTPAVQRPLDKHRSV
jgi:hypothetical protein